MVSFVKRMWTAAPVATVLLALALTACVFFGVRTTTSWVYWNDPAHIDQPIAGWMTPQYVAHSWDIPRYVMIEALALHQAGGGPRNLSRLAAERNISVEELISHLNAEIAAYRATTTDDSIR